MGEALIIVLLLVAMATDDRLQRMLDDPDGYFAEARKRARELVERDMEHERQQQRAARAEFRRNLRRSLFRLTLWRG